MDPYARRPASDVQAGDLFVWQAAQAAWTNSDGTCTIVWSLPTGSTSIETVPDTESKFAARIICPSCGHHIIPTFREESD
jgi:hypothetical protein